MVPTMTTTQPDTDNMVIIHQCFRDRFVAMPSLITAVPDGDTDRAGVLVDFLIELTTALHHHHVAEDEALWPLLLNRVGDTSAILTMEEQHERIGELIDRALAQASAFRASAREHRGEQLAVTLTALSAALNAHLDDEEAVALPLAEKHLTVAEWAHVGEIGHASIPKDRMLVFLGYILLSATDRQRAYFLAQSPLPARIAWKVLGRRKFEADYQRVHGHPSKNAVSAGPTSR
jgi:iron-sulfur cluster repair protein YtfE (RIC family)